MIELRVLGPAELLAPAGTDPDSVLARPKLLGLLSVLAASAPRGFHRRDALIGLLWAELDQERARSAVRQSLYRLRQYLGEGVVVTRGADEVGLTTDAVWCDVTEFDAAVERDDLEGALTLYRGDLLDGFYVPDAPEFERWLDQRRRELRERTAEIAWRLADREAGRRRTAEAGRWSRRARDLAPLDERLLRRVITMLDGLGDRSGAVREYEEFAKRMADDLGLEPAPETVALIEQVRTRVHSPTPSPRPASPPADDDAPDVRGLHELLRDRYVIERQLGVGGMATVYLARDVQHDRLVAVKVMHPELSTTLGRERFLREIRIAAQLAHPHIVPLFDSGVAGRFLFYVMPFVDGPTLRDRLGRDGPLPIDEAVRYAREVAGALAYAHDLGVVHRDIKPENILLTGEHAVVADFGIARAVSKAGSTLLTGSGVAVGTAPYMSPEQSSGSREVDGRSDVYSLGCVLFEMLAGERPLLAPTTWGDIADHPSAPQRQVTTLRPDVPNGVAVAIDRALATSPADRFATAREFANALGASRSGRIVDLVRPRLRALLVAASVIILAGVVASIRWIGDDPLDSHRVVVLPLQDRTGDPALDAVGQLAADWITRGLQEIDVIEVVPTVSAVEPGPDVQHLANDPPEQRARLAGQATRAGTVVAGSYYRHVDSLEFQVQIIDANAGRLVRAVSPIVAFGDATGPALDTLRRRVVASVASALDFRLLPSTALSPPPSLEAYRVYLEGHRTFYGDRMDMRTVLQHMYRAVELDTGFTDPRFFIVMAHGNLGEFRLADSNAQLLVPYRPRFTPVQRALHDWLLARLHGDRVGALQAARRRGGLDVAAEAFLANRPYEVIAVLSHVADLSQFYFRWGELIDAYHVIGAHRRELAEARRARKAFPDRMRMLQRETAALAALGRVDEIDHLLDESLLLSPEDGVDAVAMMREITAELQAHGHRTAGLAVAERALARVRSLTGGDTATGDRAGLALTLYAAERWDETQPLFEHLASDDPTAVHWRGYLGAVAARRGERERATAISESLVGMANPYEFGHDLYWQACIAAQLGELERAMELLREAYTRGRGFMVQLHADVNLLPLHSYPPFQEFIAPKR